LGVCAWVWEWVRAGEMGEDAALGGAVVKHVDVM
jgi:hypothetical protein